MAAHQETRLAAFRLGRLSRNDARFAAAVAAVFFWLAYNQGGFSISSRSAVAIAVWWTILLGIGLSVWPRTRVPRAAWTVLGALSAFAVWTFASMWWAKSAEDAFVEFDRLTLYLGIFLIAVFAGTRGNVGRWADGLGLAVAGIGVVALVSRLFPHLFSLQGLPVFLPGTEIRLSFPIGYWNGLAIYVALAYPLCLRFALVAREWWKRAAGLAPLPALSAAIYLTSSRGGVVTAWVGVIVFVASTHRRWTAFGALVAAAPGSVLAIVALLPRHELVDGPIQSSLAASQGRTAFFLILACCVGTGVAFTLGERFLGCLRLPPFAGRTLVVVLVLGAVVAIALSHPGRRFEAFKRPPSQTTFSGSFVTSHLFSGAGSGRWQFWTQAVKQFESAPVVGRGAGSYEAWWAEHAPFSYFIRNAHSLYLEVLGELGLVGLLLLVATFVSGAAAGCRRVARLETGDRITAAALLGTLIAFYLGAGIEWVWQLPAVTAVGLVCLGLLTGPATSLAEAPRAVDADAPPRPARLPTFAIGASALVVGWLIIGAQAIPWLTDLQIRSSATAVQRNDGDGALRHALAAKNLQPWAASPYLQLALVDEQRRHLPAARSWIRKAIHRDPIDWRLWLVSARIETKAGDIPSAERSLRRAASLNPRSPLFAGVGT